MSLQVPITNSQALTSQLVAGRKLYELLKAAKDEEEFAKIIIEPKILGQVKQRGWTLEDIKSTIADPFKTINTFDSRWDKAIGKRRMEPATGYENFDGSYVVVNNTDKKIVQVSDRNDKDWIKPWGK